MPAALESVFVQTHQQAGSAYNQCEGYDVFVFVFFVVFHFGRGSIFQRWRVATATQPVRVTMTSSKSVECLGLEEN